MKHKVTWLHFANGQRKGVSSSTILRSSIKDLNILWEDEYHFKSSK